MLPFVVKKSEMIIKDDEEKTNITRINETTCMHFSGKSDTIIT